MMCRLLTIFAIARFNAPQAILELRADRPRVVNVGNDQLVVLWERWEKPADDEQFTGTWALVLDGGAGTVATPAAEVSAHHINRGDDAVALDGNAVFITGHGGSINLEIVTPGLAGSTVTLP